MLKNALNIFGWSTIILAIILWLLNLGLGFNSSTIGSVWMKIRIELGSIYQLISRMAIGLLCLFAATKIES